MVKKFGAVVAALAATMALAACTPVNTPGNQPPAQPPAQQQGNKNQNIFELYVHTYDCKAIQNPLGDCSDEVKGEMPGSITLNAGPGKNGAAVILDNTGQPIGTTTKTYNVPGGFPIKGEWSVDSDIAWIYWTVHVDRMYPETRVKCYLYLNGDLDHPLVQLGGKDEYINDFTRSTTGDVVCGYPQGFPAPHFP